MKNKTFKRKQPANTHNTIAVIKPAVTFAGIIRPLIAEPVKPVAKVNLQSSPLAHLPYEEELKVKNEGLSSFWKHFKLPGTPEPVIESPLPRKYRTTSKRRAVYQRKKLYLLLSDNTLSAQKKTFVPSPIEPNEHTIIYKFLQEKISEPAFKVVATHLNYLIIRGNYKEQAVIFNVDTMNGPLIRKLKIISSHLQKIKAKVNAAYVYPDPSGSSYYLEERQAADLLNFKKLFGKAHLTVSHPPCRFSFHPTSFSQVNESMVPTMLAETKKLLAPVKEKELLDLYCGYGLFSHYFASNYKQVLGIDAEGPSIRSAMHNKKSNKHAGRTRFLAKRITEDTIRQIPAQKKPEAIILDPPRKGPAEKVITALCNREPKKVVHIHCGVDQIPDAIKQWQNGGYEVKKVIPLDMFPGSANLEVLILYSQIPQ